MMICVLDSGFAEVEPFLPNLIIGARKYVLVEQSYGLHSFVLSFAFHLQDVLVLLCHPETRDRQREKQ